MSDRPWHGHAKSWSGALPRPTVLAKPEGRQAVAFQKQIDMAAGLAEVLVEAGHHDLTGAGMADHQADTPLQIDGCEAVRPSGHHGGGGVSVDGIDAASPTAVALLYQPAWQALLRV